MFSTDGKHVYARGDGLAVLPVVDQLGGARFPAVAHLHLKLAEGAAERFGSL